MRVYYLMLIIFIVFSSSCTRPLEEDFNYNPSFALPLFNDRISLQDIFGISENIEYNVGPEGEATIIYKSEILDESIQDLLPSIPGFGEIPLFDTVNSVDLNLFTDLIIKKALLSGDELRFRYSANTAENFQIMMTIPELQKDGEPLKQEFTLEYAGTVPFTAFAEPINLSGFEMITPNNLITIIYDARNENGDRVKLEYAAFSFNELNFSYAEGNVPREESPLVGNQIGINVYDSWLEGLLEFENPTVKFQIEHAYGFPLALRVNSVDLELLDGSIKSLNGISVGQEQLLNYVAFGDIGETAKTTLTFDRSNSNINSLFNEKAVSLSYDVDAIINPASDGELLGFVDENSFLKMEVDVNVPMKQKISELVLSRAIPFDSIGNIDIQSAEFKIVSSNALPVRIGLQVEFLDESDQLLFQLFDNERLDLDVGTINPDDSTTPSEEKISYVELDQQKLQLLSEVRNLVIKPFFDTSEISEDFVQIYDDQYFDLRIGLIISI